jgi:hypothetical protein
MMKKRQLNILGVILIMGDNFMKYKFVCALFIFYLQSQHQQRSITMDILMGPA